MIGLIRCLINGVKNKGEMMTVIAIVSVVFNGLLLYKLKRTLDKLHRVLGR